MGNRAVFLDRDGVINRAIRDNNGYRPPFSPEEFEFLPGVIDTLHRLRSAGLKLLVVTNQPDVARGRLPFQMLKRVHQHMNDSFRFDGIYACTHDDGHHCDCRKPKPGLIFQSAREHGVDIRRSFLVGDRDKDIEAGRSAGCVTVFVKKSYSGKAWGDFLARDLPDAAGLILKELGGQS